MAKQLVITIPIPLNADPDAIIEALHDPSNLLKIEPSVGSWKEGESHCREEINDLFFTGRSCIDIVSKTISYSSVQNLPRTTLFSRIFRRTAPSPVAVSIVLQDTNDGARCKVEVSGKLIIYSQWYVSREHDSTDQWRIEDSTRVEGSSSMISSRMGEITAAHLAFLKNILSCGWKAENATPNDSHAKVSWSDARKGNWMGIGFA